MEPVALGARHAAAEALKMQETYWFRYEHSSSRVVCEYARHACLESDHERRMFVQVFGEHHSCILHCDGCQGGPISLDCDVLGRCLAHHIHFHYNSHSCELCAASEGNGSAGEAVGVHSDSNWCCMCYIRNSQCCFGSEECPRITLKSHTHVILRVLQPHTCFDAYQLQTHARITQHSILQRNVPSYSVTQTSCEALSLHCSETSSRKTIARGSQISTYVLRFKLRCSQLSVRTSRRFTYIPFSVLLIFLPIVGPVHGILRPNSIYAGHSRLHIACCCGSRLRKEAARGVCLRGMMRH